jgi:hypothetical protein
MCNESATKTPLWNSLEISKLIAATLTPIAITWLTITLDQQKTKQESIDKQNAVEYQENTARQAVDAERFAQVAKQRVIIWTQLSPLVNDVYSYFLYVGRFKEFGPDDIIERKRRIDALMYSNRPFFTEKFWSRYATFMHATFKTQNEWLKDAELMTAPARPKDKHKEKMFARNGGEYVDNTTSIFKAYFDWLDYAAEEMDLKLDPPRIPAQPQAPTADEVEKGLKDNGARP